MEMQMPTLEIPEFLRRQAHPINEFLEQNKKPYITVAMSNRPLTNLYKERIATEVNIAVMSGSNTFGKLRNKLSIRFSDREIRAGINFARRQWLPISMKQMKLKNKYKTYYVETA